MFAETRDKDGNPRDISPARAERLMRLATYASVCVAGILIVLKAGAVALTGSVALLSSLVDSLLDAVASVANLLAIRHALTPPDEEHRFGHGKAESLAALGQSALISGSAVFLLWESGARLLTPVPTEQGLIGIGVMVVSMGLTLALVLFQRAVVRRTGSLAITADSLHYKSDFLMNAAVIAALALSYFGGLVYADPIFAIAIAFYILYSAWAILRDALGQLMDRELPDEDRERVREIVMSHPDVLDMHDLRTRASGNQTFIQLHLELEGGMSLYRAHVIADTVEADIKAQFPSAEVIIHQDPAGAEDDISELARR